MSDEIDWAAFRHDAHQAAREAGDATTDALAGRISSVCRLRDDEVKELFPEAGDAERAAELLELVKGRTDDNTKTARLTERIGDLGGVAVKLLKVLA